MRLTSDDLAERVAAQRGFLAWRESDPLHAEAAARLQGLIGTIQGWQAADQSTATPARAALTAVLTAKRTKRARVSGTVAAVLLLVCILCLPLWLALHTSGVALSALLADVHTGTGRWQTHRLPDGSSITLGSASAVNLHFDGQRRTIELVRGEVLVDVAHDAARPFLVETADGAIRALGTRFSVKKEADATLLVMLESKVLVRTAAEQKRSPGLVVDAGRQLRFTQDVTGPLQDVDVRAATDAWRYRQLVVNARPLAEVLDQLARYRSGGIVYDRNALKDMVVSAVLPLDDTDRALQLLSASFPGLRFRTFTPYLVLVE